MLPVTQIKSFYINGMNKNPTEDVGFLNQKAHI